MPGVRGFRFVCGLLTTANERHRHPAAVQKCPVSRVGYCGRGFGELVMVCELKPPA